MEVSAHSDQSRWLTRTDLYMGGKGSNNEHRGHKSSGTSQSDGAREYLHRDNVHHGRQFLKHSWKQYRSRRLVRGDRRPGPGGIGRMAASAGPVLGLSPQDRQSARRSQAGRCQPIIDVRGGFDQPGLAKHRVALKAGQEWLRSISCPHGFQRRLIMRRRFRLAVLSSRHKALLVTGGSLQHSQSPVSARGGAVITAVDTPYVR